MPDTKPDLVGPMNIDMSGKCFGCGVSIHAANPTHVKGCRFSIASGEVEKAAPAPVSGAAPLDEDITAEECLRDLCAWLIHQREIHTVHVEPTDRFGRTYDHPSGFAAVRIPEWDVRQKIDNINNALKESLDK